MNLYAEDRDKYLGVGSCASSNCHGGINASAKSDILRNEFYTWLKFDQHSKSYNTLLNEESKKIAYHLGISAPEKEKLCLDCHATNAPNQGEKFRIEDGVGCESCHGPAGGWIQSHTEKGASRTRNIQHGLIDLNSLDKRARLCTSCHFGDSTKEVTHNLYGAGHPRLSFELDTFEAVQPRHWKIDSDYIDRKGAYRPTIGWAYGQLALARSQIDQLKRHSTAQGLFPEFSQFSCYSCHQSLNSKAFMYRERNSSPGLPRFNFTHLEMVSILLHASKNDISTEWTATLQKLKDAPLSEDITDNLSHLEKLLIGISMQESTLSASTLVEHIMHLATSRSGFDQQFAEQLVMALSAANAETPIISKQKLQKLYSLVRVPETFNSGYFSTALKSLK